MREHEYGELRLVSNEPMEWACDCYRGYIGYSVNIAGVWPDNVGFPAFTHEQMKECARLNENLGNRYSFEEFPHVVYNEESNTWQETYWDATIDIEPFAVDGIELFALGRESGWPWGEIEDGYEYEV